jgi:hypothetical protein
MSVLKRQRELRKAEKAAKKRAKRHGGGGATDAFVEPRPTVSLADLIRSSESENRSEQNDSSPTKQSARSGEEHDS